MCNACRNCLLAESEEESAQIRQTMQNTFLSTKSCVDEKMNILKQSIDASALENLANEIKTQINDSQTELQAICDGRETLRKELDCKIKGLVSQWQDQVKTLLKLDKDITEITHSEHTVQFKRESICVHFRFHRFTNNRHFTAASDGHSHCR